VNRRVSVIVPTHSPHPGRLARTIAGLRGQTLAMDQWDLVIVDNRSPEPVAVDLGWHRAARVVREDRLGLTNARLAGGAATKGELLLFVDDDNVLAPDYLLAAARRFETHPRLGAAGGKSVPEWEAPPGAWVAEFTSTLALRDLGETVSLDGPGTAAGYPAAAPLGAGMVLRRAAWDAYTTALANGGTTPLDRTGTALTSGGDNDIVCHVLRAGWQVGYFPELSLTHLIPAGRASPEYLARLNHGIAKSWVQVLDRHRIRPWPRIAPWTVPLRKWRAYFRYRAWAGPAEYVRWRGACGQFEGQSALR
jgi:glycosyltransferase involved in cell wall biosynthesis